MRNLTDEEKIEIIKCLGCPQGDKILSDEITIDEAVLSFRYKILLGRLKNTNKAFVFDPFKNTVFDALTEEEFPATRFLNCCFIDSIGSMIALNKDFVEQVNTKMKEVLKEKIESYVDFYKYLMLEEIKVLNKTLYTKNFNLFVTLSLLANIKNNTKEARVSICENNEFKRNDLSKYLKNLLTIKDEHFGSVDVYSSPQCIKIKKPKKLSLLLNRNTPVFFDEVVLAS